MGTPASLELGKPTNVRFGVLGYLCSLSLVLYIDRICISKAAPSIQAELDLTNTQMGFVFGSFMIAYGLFEVITGHWGDRFGSRRVLIRIVLWWSAFTALTGSIYKFSWGVGLSDGTELILFNSFVLMLLVRFLFGAGEAGALPNAARVITRWFPPGKRGPAQASISVSNLMGGAIAPVLTAYLIKYAGWRYSFYIFGSLGIVWAYFFSRWFRDEPTQHPGVNEAERRLIVGNAPPAHATIGTGDADGPLPAPPHLAIPWGQVLTSPNTWFLGLGMMCAAFMAYMLYSWFPSYLEKARGVGNERSGWLSAMVLISGACGVLLGGWLGDWLTRKTGSRRNTLRGMGSLGLFVGGPCVLGSIHCDSAEAASALFAMAFFGLNIQLAAWWAVVPDVTGPHLGALFGLMNSMGILGGFISQVFLGWFSDYRMRQGFLGRDQWDPAFYIYAGVLWVGSLLWLGVNSTKPIVPHEAENAH